MSPQRKNAALHFSWWRRGFQHVSSEIGAGFLNIPPACLKEFLSDTLETGAGNRWIEVTKLGRISRILELRQVSRMSRTMPSSSPNKLPAPTMPLLTKPPATPAPTDAPTMPSSVHSRAHSSSVGQKKNPYFCITRSVTVCSCFIGFLPS